MALDEGGLAHPAVTDEDQFELGDRAMCIRWLGHLAALCGAGGGRG
eukprot:SAG31_NODE_3044_length_4751_cov_29.695615_1_plen_46_part_00